MPAKSKPPRYCRQKEKGRPDRAYTVINGRRIHLGNYGTPENYECYTKLVNQPADKVTLLLQERTKTLRTRIPGRR